MRINNNIGALNAYRQMNINNLGMERSMERINSGYRINSARDDASGLGISEKMRAQIRGMQQASANSQDAQMLVRTAEGQLGSIGEMLQQMRTLAVKAADDSNETVDRTAIQQEIDQLALEITRISDDAEHNNIKLLDGSFSAKKFQIGSNAGQNLEVTIAGSDATDLSVNALDVSSASGASSAITALDTAINTVTAERSKLGATDNRLKHTINNLDLTAENLQAAESRIRDADIAMETMEFYKKMTLQQASMSMLAQANMMPQQVLRLLG